MALESLRRNTILSQTAKWCLKSKCINEIPSAIRAHGFWSVYSILMFDTAIIVSVSNDQLAKVVGVEKWEFPFHFARNNFGLKNKRAAVALCEMQTCRTRHPNVGSVSFVQFDTRVYCPVYRVRVQVCAEIACALQNTLCTLYGLHGYDVLIHTCHTLPYTCINPGS